MVAMVTGISIDEKYYYILVLTLKDDVGTELLESSMPPIPYIEVWACRRMLNCNTDNK